jgi:hypothetical protein
MKQISEKLSDVVLKELSSSSKDKELKEFDKLLSDMKKAGLIKSPNYNLPLVDTIGKTYYSATGKNK